MTAALKLLVTPAGRAALVNAKKNGTLPIVLDTAGVTAAAFAPTGNEAQLPGEIKRIATIAGGAAAADTIHVTIRDSGSDTYSVRGVGFYLQDGTLFALYGQAAVVVEKSAQATMLLAMDVQFADIDATSITFGDTDFQLNPATTELLGVVELATDDEATAGTDAQRAVTPKALLAALNARLGVGAPSGFVKGLLTAANAVVLRAALAIKSAALKDEGDGNGLDADLLDGQHGAYYRAWSNLTGVPTNFPPSPHQHSAADITSGTLVVARGGTGIASVPAGYYLMGAGTNSMVPRAPGDVLTDIGAAAKQHSHPISDINGLQAALDTKTTPAAVATQISAAVSGLINGSPGALDTLKELADAMGDDPNFAATVTNALAGKVSKSGDTMTGALLGTSASYYGTVVSGTTSGLFAVGSQAAGGSSTLFRNDGAMASASGGVAGAFNTIWNSGNFDPSSRVASIVFTSNLDANAARRCGIFGSYGSGAVNSPAGADSGVLINFCDLVANVDGAQFWQGFSSGKLWHRQRWGGSWQPWVQIATSTGDFSTSGYIKAAGGFQYSDRRLKRDIRSRAVLRGFAIKLARMFVEWNSKEDGSHQVGLIAQSLRRIAPHYVVRDPNRGRKLGLLAIDKAGVALEASMDNALHISELQGAIDELTKRIAKLEKTR